MSNLVSLDSEFDVSIIAGFEDSIANIDNQIYHLQVAHIFKINIVIYKNSLSLQNSLINTLLAFFQKVSFSWHELAKITTNNSSK